MNTIKTKSFAAVWVLILSLLVSCNPSRQHKTETIIKKMSLIEALKANFQSQIEPLKYQATGQDSLRIIELEKLLSDEEIKKRIIQSFTNELSDKDINSIYNFVQSNAYEKFFKSGSLFTPIFTQFKDINNDIENIKQNCSEATVKPHKQLPIKMDRENGFYATVDYDNSIEPKDIQLENTPALTFKDILEVNKVLSSYNNQLEISIVLTKKGAKTFQKLTRNNIGKPIAIVMAKHIVSMPIVNTEIIGGHISINGNFSEKEIDEMIKILKER